MAKPFYSLEEAAERLKKTPAEVEELVRSGDLREFRDSGRVFFKAEDVDILATREDTGDGATRPCVIARKDAAFLLEHFASYMPAFIGVANTSAFRMFVRSVSGEQVEVAQRDESWIKHCRDILSELSASVSKVLKGRVLGVTDFELEISIDKSAQCSKAAHFLASCLVRSETDELMIDPGNNELLADAICNSIAVSAIVPPYLFLRSSWIKAVLRVERDSGLGIDIESQINELPPAVARVMNELVGHGPFLASELKQVVVPALTSLSIANAELAASRLQRIAGLLKGEEVEPKSEEL